MKSTKMHKSIDMIPHCILNDNNYVIEDKYGLRIWDKGIDNWNVFTLGPQY